MTDYERFGDYQPSSSEGTASEGTAWGTAVTFLLIGLGIGSAVALLMAPQSGRKTRKVLRRKYENAAERVDDWRDQANDMWEKGTDFAATAARRGSDWAGYAAKKVAPIAKAARRRVE
jgi:gas vesicle protein